MDRLCVSTLHLLMILCILLAVSTFGQTTRGSSDGGHMSTNDNSALNSRDIEFTIPIRLRESMAPTYLLFRKGETPEEAASGFCRQIGMYNSNCVSSLYAAVKKRLEFLNSHDQFELMEHKHIKSVNFDARVKNYFDAHNLTEIENGINFFNSQGYVIFKNVATKKEVLKAKDLMWEYLEFRFQAKRHDIETWDRIPANEYGIILQFGIGQSDFMWYVRTIPQVRKLFARLWGVEEADLIVDFGGPVIFRPVNCTKRWRTAEKWFHVDQNAASFPGKQTIQSFLSLTKQTQETGGIVVVPESWKYHNELTDRARKHWGTDEHSQFLLVPPSDEVLSMKRPIFLQVDEGDMVFWDSRVVHCNTNAHEEEMKEVKSSGEFAEESGDADGTLDLSHFVDKKKRVLDVITRLKNIREYNNFPISKHCLVKENGKSMVQLQRIVSLISMAPKIKANEQVLQKRRLAYVNEQTTTHWPFRFEADEPTLKRVKKMEDLTPLMKQLIG